MPKSYAQTHLCSMMYTCLGLKLPEARGCIALRDGILPTTSLTEQAILPSAGKQPSSQPLSCTLVRVVRELRPQAGTWLQLLFSLLQACCWTS